ncbi:MAG TPA: YidC/Oxa1 family membrane protein insertase [Clostridiales bacterium]|nr:YidC/Oxa1 family membrane protein insertase [Clostridiales bacterium]
MVFTILTKSGGMLGPIANLLGLIMNGIYEFFHLFGIQNIALSIIVFTFITKSLMIPLTLKQQKFTKLSSKMNPELQAIQAKYKGKKDEASMRKQQAETQAVYEKYGASPTAGCLPLLITLPIMFALYRVINNIPAYVNEVKVLYEAIAVELSGVTGFESIILEMAKGVRVTAEELTNNNTIIDVLAKFGSDEWHQLADKIPQISPVLEANVPSILKVNSFLGLNITNAPGWKPPAVIIPILAMALQFVQGKQMNMKNTDANKDNPSASAMNSMTTVMPIMSGVFCITLPIGVGIYWIATSVFTIIQQFFTNKYLDKVDVDDLIQKNLEKNSKKIKKHNGNPSTMSLQELAKKQTKSIDAPAVDNEVVDHNADNESDSETNNPSSISEIANLLKNRGSEKGDK